MSEPCACHASEFFVVLLSSQMQAFQAEEVETEPESEDRVQEAMLTCPRVL